MKLLIHPAIDDERLAKVQDAAGSMRVVNARDEADALEQVRDADALFGRVSAPMLAQAEKLRWVQSATASLEHYVFSELIEHPCTLTNMRGLFYDVIADHVFGYVLCFSRNLHRYIRNQLRHEWAPVGGEQISQNVATGAGVTNAIDQSHIHLGDCTLGVVGLGSIGAEIARRGLAFGMRVIAVDPIQESAPEGVEEVWRLDRLNDLLKQSDFVVIAAPHTPQTEGMFGTAQIQQMKQSAYLINIGRGAIVRLDDLVGSLQNGEIAGAGLDVFETEPLPSDHPLWEMENVIITPHIAAASVHIAKRHLETLLENVRRFVENEPLTNVTNKAAWY